LVIDEADLILSFGYDEDLKAILRFLPPIYQSYLMSATLSPDVDQLKQLVLRNPAVLKLQEADSQNLLSQFVVHCSEQDKFLLTFFILKLKLDPFGSGKCIIFVNSIERCYRLKLFLDQFGIKCCTLNSELPVKSRFHIVQEFNRGIYDYIIATDESGDLKSKEQDSEDEDQTPTQEKTPDSSKKKKKTDSEYGVSRGIDFKNVRAVLNFDVPKSSRSYMHRVGRTARGVGNKGYALTFLSDPNATTTDAKKMDASLLQQQKVFKRIEKKQTAMDRAISTFQFNMNQVEGFRYRVEDALRAVTEVSVREARLKDIKSELLNSEKLKVGFFDIFLNLFRIILKRIQRICML
jgi:ATP-dependent RNA helicase DDX56/DBP9